MYSVFICTSNVQLCWSIEESLHEVVLTARGDDLKIDTKLETKLHIYNQYIVYSISIIYIYYEIYYMYIYHVYIYYEIYYLLSEIDYYIYIYMKVYKLVYDMICSILLCI